MHPNSGDHRGVPTFDQNLKSQLKHFLNAVAVATNLAQQAIIASTSSLQQARHSCYLCLHLRKQEVQTLDGFFFFHCFHLLAFTFFCGHWFCCCCLTEARALAWGRAGLRYQGLDLCNSHSQGE